MCKERFAVLVAGMSRHARTLEYSWQWYVLISNHDGSNRMPQEQHRLGAMLRDSCFNHTMQLQGLKAGRDASGRYLE